MDLFISGEAEHSCIALGLMPSQISPASPAPTPASLESQDPRFQLPSDLTHDPQDSVGLLCDFVHGHLICGDGRMS